MKGSKSTGEQIAFALRQAETGTRVAEVRRLKQLEEENLRLKRMVADLSLNKQMFQDASSKKF